MTVAEALNAARRAPDDAVAAARLASAALDAQEEEQALPIVRAAAERLGNARLWQWAGLLHRALDDRAPAIEEFAAAARLAPADPGIAHGRARVTLEAGLPASALFERARTLAPGDGTVLLGLVAAELAAGDSERATARLAAAVAGSPDWIDGHDQLARLRWMLGDRDGFTRSYLAAIEQRPGNAALWQALLIALLHADRFDEVVETVARGRKALGDVPFLDAAAAVAASETGRIDEADALFAKLAHLDESSLAIRQVRHLLRTDRLDAAAPLVERWIARPEAALMWPYAAILWRLTGDPRGRWLDAGGALVKVIDLTPSLPPLDRLAEMLRGLHRARNQHLDQSVRGGTQTDGELFARLEPEIRATRAAVVAAVESYIAALPPRDPRHPTLAPRRDRRPRFAGSWSVRLTDAGAHASHVHPAGWISSALYIALPDDLPGDAGSLTLGAPQAELRPDLPPERIVAPRPGQLVLFPSTMWHGTIPVRSGGTIDDRLRRRHADAMNAIDPSSPLAAALDKARAGDLPGAGAAAEAAIAAGDRSPQLAAFAGLVACQLGDPARGIPHLRAALDVAPDDLATRVNLARALAACGQFDEAIASCASAGDPRLDRIAGYAHQQAGRLDKAAAAYERVLAAAPNDFESWNNLGNARSAQGDVDGAVTALRRATRLRPDAAPVRLNLAKALAKAERYEEQLEAVRAANALTPDDPEILTELGLAEASVDNFAAAESAFRAAIASDPLHLAAYLELGVLLETLNKTEALGELADEAAARGLPGREAGFLKAWALRREERYAEALPLAEAAADTINPVRRAQLIGEIADRLRDTERAFAAYTEMNRASVAAAPPSAAEGPAYLAEVRAIAERTTPEAIARWSTITVDRAPPAPVFIVGFPRSGTTLLDTLLMNLPSLHVFEEEPILNHAETGLGDLSRIGEITTAEANALRARYFEAAARIAPESRGKTIVDKFPLHMARMPIIHRLFPDAKVVFVERHPCDVVLSCFMANFQLNRAMANMTTLEGAARLYDAAQEAWTRAIELLPIEVKRIRYEAMIDDLETEMRVLLGFLGLEWDASVLDNRGSAARRAHIRTASYSQVTEPIYRRAVARWERYRAQLEPIMPIVAPWAERMGYSM